MERQAFLLGHEPDRPGCGPAQDWVQAHGLGLLANTSS